MDNIKDLMVYLNKCHPTFVGAPNGKISYDCSFKLSFTMPRFDGGHIVAYYDAVYADDVYGLVKQFKIKFGSMQQTAKWSFCKIEQSHGRQGLPGIYAFLEAADKDKARWKLCVRDKDAKWLDTKESWSLAAAKKKADRLIFDADWLRANGMKWKESK